MTSHASNPLEESFANARIQSGSVGSMSDATAVNERLRHDIHSRVFVLICPTFVHSSIYVMVCFDGR